ncbi:hypothetical protein GQ54DRAFT_37897 [Martensiomyces pterosporus]|nr:hypothetical protein GQ54DRAFT_37897 [Martensiomyces pterosporus]
MMTDLDLDSKAILNGLVYLDQHHRLPPNATSALGGQKQQPKAAKGGQTDAAAASPQGASAASAVTRLSVGTNAAATTQNLALAGISPKTGSAAGHFGGTGPHAIATLRVETSAVLKELARFRACDDQTMSCFYCREWAQWVYRKQISPQAANTSMTAAGNAGGGASSGSGSGGRKKKKSQGSGASSGHSGPSIGGGSGAGGEEAAERERLERKRAARIRFTTIGDLCKSLRSMVEEEREALLIADPIAGSAPASRSASPSPSVSSATSSTVAEQANKAAISGGKVASKAKGGSKTAKGSDGSRPTLADLVTAKADAAIAASPTASAAAANAAGGNSTLIDSMVDQVTLWYEGYQFPLADVYEDLTFDFPPDAFPYDDHQDPLDPALLLPALQVTKTYISLPASNFPLLGNITSELIATHTYPTCQHTKADHPTPSELETQRLIFNSQLQKWRNEYKRSFEREMEPVWQITQLLLKSAQRIEAMRVRLFARGCRANREQFLQTIRNRTQPFTEYWTRVSEPYRTGKAATIVSDADADADADDEGPGDQQAVSAAKKAKSKKGSAQQLQVKSSEQLAEELDGLVLKHLDNLLEVSSSWSRTFLESYYGVAREFARELETILGECITMCDRRAQGLKYPPPLTLQPQLEKARSAISCLLPQLEARIEKIQEVVRERNAEIFNGTEEVRTMWTETSGATMQSKLAKAAHKDFRKKVRRIEYQQQTGVIGWAMRELEHLLTAPDVATVVADCLELLMTEAEILERAVGQVFVRKLEPTTEDLREQRQDIIDDFTEGLLTGREELAGIIGKLMLKEAWRILEANISLQRQKALLDGGGSGGSGKSKKSKSSHSASATASNSGHGKQRQDAQVPVSPVNPTASAQQQQQNPPTPVAYPQGDQSSVADDDDFLNDDMDSAAAKKKKKNKKKKNKKKKAKQAAAAAAAAAASSLAPDALLVADDDDDGEGDEIDNDGDEESAVRDPQNPFASLSLSNSNGEPASDTGEGRHEDTTAEEEEDMAAVASETKDRPAKAPSQQQTQALLQKQQQQQQQKANASTSEDSSPPKQRARRGTNAARYVPGVGFISDDGVSATSPQPVPNVTATFKGSSNGMAGSPVGSLPIQTSGTVGPRVSNGRLSPLSPAAVASPASRAQSPAGALASSAATTGAAGGKNPGEAALDNAALAALKSDLTERAEKERIEQTLDGLAHKNLVVLAAAALREKSMMSRAAMEWYLSLNKLLRSYDEIEPEVQALRDLCNKHDEEIARLSSLLAQAAQEAQRWHESYDKLSEDMAALHVSKAAASAAEKASESNPAGASESNGSDTGNEPKDAPTTSAHAAVPSSQPNMWSIGEARQQQRQRQSIDAQSWVGFGGQQQQQQQQLPVGFGSGNNLAAALSAQYGGGGFGQFPGMMPGGGNLATSFMHSPAFAAAAAAAAQLQGSMDPASLMLFAGSQMSAAPNAASQIPQQQQQQLPGFSTMTTASMDSPFSLGLLSSGVLSGNSNGALNDPVPTLQQQHMPADQQRGNGGPIATATPANATSASLLTALNASQPF